MTVYFTSDTHFRHEAAINHSFRPFASVDEMDEALVQRWNARVKKGDTVWHLGDFTMKNAGVAEYFANRLNGTIHLIWGNHDRPAVRTMTRWASSQYAIEISHMGYKIVLCHYAMKTWNRAHHGSLMLYGHSHANLPGNRQSLDVGVDAWDWHPVTLLEILAQMATLPSFVSPDHHQADAPVTLL